MALGDRPEQLSAISEILLGAAHADGTLDSEEVSRVPALLKAAFRLEELPTETVTRMAAFDPDRFDLRAACAALKFEDRAERVELLTLVMAVVDADFVRDRSEEGYLFQLAEAIDATDDVLDVLFAD